MTWGPGTQQLSITFDNVVTTEEIERIFSVEFPFNKDHQRMMVDPMLMIVLDLRSFLTAVTPTAVAPTAVIL